MVHKGEQRGIFVDKMPPAIQQAIHAENITFVKNRDVYSSDYFAFLVRLTSTNAVSVWLQTNLSSNLPLFCLGCSVCRTVSVCWTVSVCMTVCLTVSVYLSVCLGVSAWVCLPMSVFLIVSVYLTVSVCLGVSSW